MRLRKALRIQQTPEEGEDADCQRHPANQDFPYPWVLGKVSFDLGNTGIMKLLRKTKYNPETGKQTQSDRNTLVI